MLARCIGLSACAAQPMYHASTGRSYGRLSEATIRARWRHLTDFRAPRRQPPPATQRRPPPDSARRVTN